MEGETKAPSIACCTPFRLFSRLPESEFVPDILKIREWALKQMATALGGWVEFRHDTVLYSKQSYTGVGAALVPASPEGYIEPYLSSTGAYPG
jgi:hypothetical protein